jgi:hypothetical protein
VRLAEKGGAHVDRGLPACRIGVHPFQFAYVPAPPGQ